MTEHQHEHDHRGQRCCFRGVFHLEAGLIYAVTGAGCFIALPVAFAMKGSTEPSAGGTEVHGFNRRAGWNISKPAS